MAAACASDLPACCGNVGDRSFASVQARAPNLIRKPVHDCWLQMLLPSSYLLTYLLYDDISNTLRVVDEFVIYPQMSTTCTVQTCTNARKCLCGLSHVCTLDRRGQSGFVSSGGQEATRSSLGGSASAWLMAWRLRRHRDTQEHTRGVRNISSVEGCKCACVCAQAYLRMFGDVYLCAGVGMYTMHCVHPYNMIRVWLVDGFHNTSQSTQATKIRHVRITYFPTFPRPCKTDLPRCCYLHDTTVSSALVQNVFVLSRNLTTLAPHQSRPLSLSTRARPHCWLFLSTS